MTLLDVEELTRYWINHPPLHLMVAAHLGFGETSRRTRSGTPAAAPPAKGQNLHIGAVLAKLGSSFVDRDVHEGLGPAVLDFTELKRSLRRPD
jgi:hypothetical protein